MKYIVTFLLGTLAVAIGAFGAHALSGVMDEYGKEIYNTGNRYHFYHVLQMLFICILMTMKGSHNLLSIAWYLSLIGILLFSGSLYLLATRAGHPIPGSILGPITPLGGTFFIGSWILLMLYAFKNLQ